MLKINTLIISALCFLNFSHILFAQQSPVNIIQIPSAINHQGLHPSTNAILDIQSNKLPSAGVSNPKQQGVLLPRMSTNDKTLIPASSGDKGLLVYDLGSPVGSSEGYSYWNGVKWLRILTNEDGTNSLIEDSDKSTRVQTEGQSGSNVDVVTIHLDTDNNAEFSFLKGNSGMPRMELGLTTPFNNVLIGKSAGDNLDLINGVPAENTALGDESLSALTLGSQNTAIGSHSLEKIIVGGGNVALGAYAGQNVGGTGNTFLGLNTSGATNSNFSNVIAVGANALKNNTKSEIVAVGFNSLTENDGEKNTAIGFKSMTLSNTGEKNIAIGHSAMELHNTGNENIAVGSNALRNNRGNNNLAIGASALAANVNGKENTAFGSGTLFNNVAGNYNTALGGAASIKNVSGEKNVTVGGYALRRNETGSENVALGFEAGSHDNLTSPVPGVYDAVGSVFIGHKAGYNYPNGKDNKLYIGNNSTPINSINPSTLVYGEFDNALVEIDSYLRLKPILVEDSSKCNVSNEGMMYYNETMKKVRFCNGTNWMDL